MKAPNAYHAYPRVQVLGVDRKPRELKAVCKERGIKLW